MSNIFKNMLRGLAKRLFSKKKTKNYPPIGWFKEKLLKHQEDKKLKLLKFGKFLIQYRLPYEILHTYNELFEEEIYRFESKKKHPYIIDCGANVGLSVIYFKSLYPDSNIIAFEPDEDNFQLLIKNIELNQLSNVSAIQSAVWIKNEPIYFNSIGSQGSQIASTLSTQSNSLKEIKAIRLAEILEKNDVDFLKIDIEGAEYEVIKDCANSLSTVSNLFVEYHGKVNETNKLSELLEIFHTNNFEVYIKMAADRLNFPFVNKTTAESFDVQLNIFCFRK